MNEYISRDEAINAIKSLESSMPAKDNYAKGYDAALGRVQIAVRAVPPAADVQSVKRGEWKYCKNNGIIDTYICTNCHGKVEMAIDVEPSKFKYCPNCGARMDGGDKDDS